MDLLAKNDLEVILSGLEAIVNYHKKNQLCQEELKSILNVVEEIESSKEKELFYQKQLSQLSKITENDGSLVTKYIDQKERCGHLEHQVETLSKNVEELKSQFLKEKEVLVTEYEGRITNIRNEMEIQKSKFESNEKHLYNEMQGIQAAAAMQCDELEMKMNSLLSEANQKLRESHSSCNTLRSELLRTKNQMSQMSIILNSKQKECQELQDKLHLLEEKFFKVHETNISDDVASLLKNDLICTDKDLKSKTKKVNSFKETNVNSSTHEPERIINKNFKEIKNNTKSISSYKPLELHMTKKIIESDKEFHDFQQKTIKKDKNILIKNNLPPLIQLMNNKNTKNVPKKRKLHSINDLTNLNEN